MKNIHSLISYRAITIIGFLIIAFVVLFWQTQKKQDMRNKAAVPRSNVEVRVSPSSRQYLAGEKVVVHFTAVMQDQPIDGIQLVAKFEGIPHDSLTFEPSDIPGMQVRGVQSQLSSTGMLFQLAYVTEDPTQPFHNFSFLSLGTLMFTAPESGKLTISFDRKLSKIIRNGTSADILEYPEDVVYTFATPTPTPTPIPTEIPPTPTPTPVVCLPGDIDRNGLVNQADLTVLLRNLYKIPSAAEPGTDITNDGFIDISDYALLAKSFNGQTGACI